MAGCSIEVIVNWVSEVNDQCWSFSHSLPFSESKWLRQDRTEKKEFSWKSQVLGPGPQSTHSIKRQDIFIFIYMHYCCRVVQEPGLAWCLNYFFFSSSFSFLAIFPSHNFHLYFLPYAFFFEKSFVYVLHMYVYVYACWVEAV